MISCDRNSSDQKRQGSREQGAKGKDSKFTLPRGIQRK
ncbi:hypothetical protein COO91_03081 [Nostoc flagelliforme CCNUN1]|uniref:Uncharacterized protein n=1 Tax=Nostoc flagelliforme CCNUN1 TaxID=2038116 RepID=A0A2K8SQR0_9NOSO|nr:hypothetical protein COO91_03081 [Nostoc flagelliforme CCNUN1]